MTVEQRLARVEKANKRLTTIALALAVVAGFALYREYRNLFSSGSRIEDFNTIIAKRLIIIDDDHTTPRWQVDAGSDGSVVEIFTDGAGKSRLSHRVYLTGEVKQDFMDADNQVRMQIRADSHGTVTQRFADREGKVTTSLPSP